MLQSKHLNIIIHLLAPFLVLIFQDIDVVNYLLGLVISFLISNQFFSCEYKHLSFNKIFLIGAYYYLAIFPIFYSLNLFQAVTFNPEALSLTSMVCILSLLGYSTGVLLYDNFRQRRNLSIPSASSFTYGLGTRQIDSYLIGLLLLTNIIFIFAISEIRSFFIISTVIILLIKIKHSNLSRSIALLVTLLTVFTSVIAILLLTTSRSDLIKLVIVIGFLYSFLNRKEVNLIKLASVGIFLFLGAILITINRSNTGISIAGNIDSMFQYYQGIIGILMRLGDIGIAFDNLIYIVKNITFEELLLGSTLIRPLLYFVPRSLWAAKPQDTQLLIVEERYGALSEFGGGTSQSITIIGELYWNFSFFGVFFGLLLLAIIIKNLDFILSKTKSLSTIYFLSVLTPFFFVIWRGAYSSELVYSLVSLFPIFLLVFLHKLFKELPIFFKES